METVIIQTPPSDDNPSGHVVINQSDFDETVHVLVGAKVEEVEEKKTRGRHSR